MTAKQAMETTDRERSVIDVRPTAGPSGRPRFGSQDNARFGAVGLDEPAPGQNVPQSLLFPKPKKSKVDLDPEQPVKLVEHLAHHLVDDLHLWIAVEDGKILVANDRDNAIFEDILAGKSPAAAAAALTARTGTDPNSAWSDILALIGRLTAAGFVDGVTGYHAIKKIRPYAFARFHLTNRCQLECVHCYTNSSPTLPSDDELPVERWIKLIEDFAANGGEKALFTGGEALVYRGCIDVMRRAHELGLEVTLFSNGVLVPRYLDELREVADIVQVSIDGPGPESHDAIRGPGQFAKAMKAIDALLEAGIETRVSTTVMVNNWSAIEQDFEKLVNQYKDTDLSFRVSYGAMSHGRGTDLDHNLDTASVRAFVDQLLTRVNTTENRETGCNVVQKISGCGYAEQLVVAPDGIVYPCHLMSGALGHIDDLPLYRITHYLKRTSEAFSVDHRVGCGTCDMRNLCGGTCRVDDEKQTGSRFVTTCTPEEKMRKKRFLVRRYLPTDPQGA